MWGWGGISLTIIVHAVDRDADTYLDLDTSSV